MKRIVLLAAGVLAALSLTAAPASAGASGSSNVCNGWEAESSASFSSLGSLTASASTARGIGRGEPNINANFAALPLGTDGQADPSFDVTVPVWFHVITDGATGDLTDAQIDAQMAVLNMAYAGFYGGYDTGFSFELQGVTRTDNATWFNARLGGGAERDMKKHATAGRLRDAQHLHQPRRRLPGLRVLPRPPGLAAVSGRRRDPLGLGARCVDAVRRSLRPRPDADPRGRTLARARAHLRRAAATRRATTSTTRRRWRCRRAAARPERTRA